MRSGNGANLKRLCPDRPHPLCAPPHRSKKATQHPFDAGAEPCKAVHPCRNTLSAKSVGKIIREVAAITPKKIVVVARILRLESGGQLAHSFAGQLCVAEEYSLTKV